MADIETGDAIQADQFIPSYTAGETLSAGDAVAYDHSDNKVYKASASAWAYRINFIGFALAAATSGNPVQVNTGAIVTQKTGLTANTDYYLSDTNGAISTSAGTISRKIGRTWSTTRIVRPKNGAMVSGLISRTLSSATAYAHLHVYAFFDSASKTTTVNGTALYSSASSDDISNNFQLAPDDTVTVSGGGGTVYVRIIDR